jgi:hypothetical protein
MKRSLYGWIMAALLLSGCVTAPVVIEKQEVVAPVVKPAEELTATPAEPVVQDKPPRLFEDRDLLLDGVKFLNLPDRPAPAKARSIFISLIQFYPQSRWRPAAEAFIRLIDEWETFREANRQDHLLTDKAKADKTKTVQENETLKKTVRELTERLQTETAALAQENEKLKKDIDRLKALEIELEKRERKLR